MGLQPVLDTQVAVPNQTLGSRIGKSDEQEGGAELPVELCSFGDATGDGGRNRGRKGQKEETIDQRVALILCQGLGVAEELDAVGNSGQ